MAIARAFRPSTNSAPMPIAQAIPANIADDGTGAGTGSLATPEVYPSPRQKPVEASAQHKRKVVVQYGLDSIFKARKASHATVA